MRNRPYFSLRYQYPPRLLGAGPWFRSRGYGYSNLVFDDRYIVDFESAIHPQWTFTSLRLTNTSDRLLMRLLFIPDQHILPDNASSDPDFMTNQEGAAADTYNACFLAPISPYYTRVALTSDELLDLFRWDAAYVGSSAFTIPISLTGALVGEEWRGLRAKYYTKEGTSPTYAQYINLSPIADYDLLDLNQISDPTMDGGGNWTVAAPGAGGGASIAGGKITITGGGTPSASGPNTNWYGVYQEWDGTSDFDMDRVRRIRFDDDDNTADGDDIAGASVDVETNISDLALKAASACCNTPIITAKTKSAHTGWEISTDGGGTWSTLSTDPAPGDPATLIRYTVQENLPAKKFQYRVIQISEDVGGNEVERKTLIEKVDIADQYQVWYDDEQPTFPSVSIDTAMGGVVWYFIYQIMDGDDDGYSYIMIGNKDTSAAATGEVSLDLSSYGYEVYDGDMFTYKVLIDENSLGGEGYIKIVLDDASEIIPSTVLSIGQYGNWQHVSADLSAAAGKTIDKIIFVYETSDTPTGGFRVLFNYLQVLNLVDFFRGKLFRAEMTVKKNNLVNGKGYVWFATKAMLGGATEKHWYAYFDTDSISNNVETKVVRYLYFPYEKDVEKIYVYVGMDGDCTSGTFEVMDLYMYAMPSMYLECAYTMKDLDGFNTASEYGEKAWGFKLNGTYFNVEDNY